MLFLTLATKPFRSSAQAAVVMFTVSFIIVSELVTQRLYFPTLPSHPMRRGELALLGLCQVQVSVYSLSLFCCADSRAGEREPSFMLPRLCLHRQRGQSHNLISSSANNMEPSETALMSEHIRMKRETADENTRWERV